MTIAEEVEKYYWWHTIDLGDGVITPGRKSLDLMQLEAKTLFDGVDLRHKTVLDVGAWNGGFCVEAARRGAAKVVGLDHATWNNPRLHGRETFDLVSRATGNRFDAVDIDLDKPGLSLDFLAKFDIVLFSGVFHHLVDPIAATREIAALAKECLIVETHIETIASGGRPVMIFYPGAELSDDPTNWWGPNIECMIGLLNFFGFPHVTVRDGSGESRKVFHAYRNSARPT